jgi:UDP-GlcNAc:undecaprenyl-phosphate GlcNAc-1-phosphate transferase
MGLSIVRRFLQLQPIFRGDRNHVHHRLLDRGLSPGRVALVLSLASGLAGSFALLQSWASREIAWVVVSVWSVIVWMGLRELRYCEFGIAARLLRQNNLRSMVKENLSLLRCEAALKSAASSEECWSAIRTVSSECGFSAAALRLGRWTYHELPEQAGDRYTLHIPLSDSDYVQLMCRFPCSAGPMIIGPLADLLREVLSAKGAQFGPVQILPRKAMVAAVGLAPWANSEQVESAHQL